MENNKINVYIDTLIFGIQKMGGISVVWYEYIKRMLQDRRILLTLIDLDIDYKNLLFNELNTTNAAHVKEKGKKLEILRIKKPRFKAPESPVIFQSTYLRTCKCKNVKNIVLIHDMTHQLYFKGIKKWINTIQTKRAIQDADGIICVSQNTLFDLHRIFPKSKNIKTTVIYNSASSDYKIISEPVIPSRYLELTGKKFFIYVGDRSPYKNTGFLFDILKEYDIDCVLIGGADFSAKEKQEIETFDLMARIHRFTNVPNDELNILYNMAFCMIYPSLYEGFGIPVLEAMQAGCPVIAFNNSSIPEVLRGSGIMLETNDISGAVNSLFKLEDQQIREKIIRGQLEAAKYFNWEKSYQELIDFYAEILD